jgi:nucleoside-diphosphate-sugar epimerase
MLEHSYPAPQRPDRVVILGAGGFVGGTVKAVFDREGTGVLGLARKDLDLLAGDADAHLAGLLKPTDTLIVVSAEAPCKTSDMLVRNIAMMAAVCRTLAAIKPAHVIYVSSDAVYADGPVPLNEASPTAPGSLHGVMHLARELMLKEAAKSPLAIVRPTLIYGAADPHNGYGPNRFHRLAQHGEAIVLFGEGEERRDHISVDDVAELIRLVAWHRSHGVLNAATGGVHSFREIAEFIVGLSGKQVEIRATARIGPMPHNGYRPFDPRATKQAFPSFVYLGLAAGLQALRDGAQLK